MGSQPDRGGRSEQSRRERDSAPTGGGTAITTLGDVMSHLARSLQRQHGDVEATLEAITAGAVGAVPGAEAASVSYVQGRRRVESRAATGDLPRKVDDVQTRLQEGPCLDSVWHQKTVRIDDMAAEERWPRFAAEAAGLGIGSNLSLQLFVEGDNLGALNLYAGRPHAFGEESEDVGLVFATHAAVALSGAQQEENLQRAVSSRDLIGQAKGILMERYRLTGDQAFALLVGASSRTNRRLLDIAEELSATGDLPER
ncbi:GAF and ANTAR domain-containing protein [Geodermatophilus sp. URMC 64]